MTAKFSTGLRNTMLETSPLKTIMNLSFIKIYSGPPPADADAAVTGTLLGTVTLGAAIGTTSSGAIDWDEASATQNNATHVSGTPTFVDLETSGGTVLFRTDLGGGTVLGADR